MVKTSVGPNDKMFEVLDWFMWVLKLMLDDFV